MYPNVEIGVIMSNVPPEKPRLSSRELRKLISRFEINRDAYPLVIVGIRGYYKKTMGAPNVNDRGIYDDAMFIDTLQATVSYNANTDPSKFRAGLGTGNNKGMACLDPGIWYVHRFDKHNGQYLALCQRGGPVTVTRDGTPPYKDTGSFGINIHRGSYRGTSSLGCQTIHPSQWDSFIKLAEDQARRYFGRRWQDQIIPYVLLENKRN